MKQNQKGFAHIPIIIILALVLAVVGYFVFRGDTNNIVNEFNNEPENAGNEFEGWETYTSQNYQFQIQYPDYWQILETGDGVIFYDGPEYTHWLSDTSSQVVIAPDGIPTASPMGPYREIDVSLTGALEAMIREHYLQDTNDIYGYYIRFDMMPSTWEERGLVWTSAPVENKSIYCGEGRSYERGECDPVEHPLYLNGSADQSDLQTIKQILSTFQFTN